MRFVDGKNLPKPVEVVKLAAGDGSPNSSLTFHDGAP